MKTPRKPSNEEIRLAVLKGTGLLDSERDDAFSGLTELGRLTFDVPVCAFSLVDEYRLWFKSIQGLDICELERDVSFCAHVVALEKTLIVEDATRDPRFDNNPFVVGEPHIRFYAGAPVRLQIGRERVDLGAICLVDFEPRSLDEREQRLLELYAKETEALVNAHMTRRHLEDTCDKLKRTLRHLESFERGKS